MINKNVLITTLLACLLGCHSLASGTPQKSSAYAILPFIKTISQQTQKNLGISYDNFENVLQTTLSQNPNGIPNVQQLTGEQPLNYFGDDFSQRVDANQRLHNLSKAKKLDVLIFGSIQESSEQDAIELSVVVYFASKAENQAFLAFYNERIKHNGGVQKPKKRSLWADIVNLLGGSELPSKSQQQSQQQLKAKQLAQNVKQWFTKIDTTTKAQSGQAPVKNVTDHPAQFYREAKTLKEIYTMLYEQEHYVYTHPNDEQVLQEISSEKGISLSQLKNELTQHWRQGNHLAYKNSCEMRGLVSVAQSKKKGKIYKLCFDPNYINTECSPTAGKMRKMTYEQVKQELIELNTKSQSKDWRIPTIDELFAMGSLLPEPSIGEIPLSYWSSTAKTQTKTDMWGLSMDVIYVRNIAKIYRAYVTTLQENDSAFLIPIKNCPELNNPF